MSSQFLFFFLLCDGLIMSKSAQQNVVCIQLVQEAEMDGDYGRERQDWFGPAGGGTCRESLVKSL